MKAIEEFFLELDSLWRDSAPDRIPLKVIGSGALMLQTDYDRGTKDGDVLQTHHLTPQISERLLKLAGQGSDMAKRRRMYLEIVHNALPLLPQRPVFHPVPAFASLRHFSIEVLDVVDVVVSKFKRFNANDAKDVESMIKLGKVPHGQLVERFRLAVDAFSIDAGAEDLPRCVRNLNAAERDYFRLPESDIELSDWI